MLFMSPCAQAAGFKSPEECLAYTGDAHLNCLYAYIEIQKDKLAKLEDELNNQKGILGQLRDQVNRQTSVTNELQRRMAEQPAAVPPSPAAPYPYASYGYPPPVGYYSYAPGFGVYGSPRGIGLSLSIGPGFYPAPYVFYSPPFYGYRHRWR
jgi:hypothetical protein